MVLTEEERKERRRISSKKQSEKRSLKRKQKREEKKLEKEKNKDLIRIKYNERKNNYTKTEKGKKITIKCNWKYLGIKLDNFNEIYERYTNAIFCDICECVLNVEGNDNSRKCLDHDHDSGDFRNIVCNYCNLHICK